MKNRQLQFLFVFVITLYLQAGCSSPAAGEIPADTRAKQSVEEAIRAAESLFAQRADLDKLRAAVEIMAKLRDPSDRNFDVEWQFARFSYFLGKQTEDDSEAESVLERGREAGLIASRIDPARPEGHFWYAANLGELANLSPVTVGIKSVDDIRAAMTRVTELQPDYQAASAFDALGQLEMKTRLYGGKAETAVTHFEKGVRLAPGNAPMRANLAEAYLAVKRDADARREIDSVLSAKPDPLYAIEHEAAVAKARRLLATSF